MNAIITINRPEDRQRWARALQGQNRPAWIGLEHWEELRAGTATSLAFAEFSRMTTEFDYGFMRQLFDLPD